MTVLVDYDRELPPLDVTLSGTPEAPPPLRRRTLRRVARWVVGHRLDLTLIAILTVAGGLVHIVGMDSSPARFDDEGTYTAYAWAVQNWHQLGHYTYWYAHPPLGWMQIALWTWLTDGFDRAPYAVAAAREFMLAAKLTSIVLVFLLARRLGMGRVGAVLGVVIFAFSPLAVYFTRAALLDNIVTPWLLGAFFFAASRRRSVRGAVGSGVCLAVAVLTKETALLYLPAVVLVLWQYTDKRNRRFCLGLFVASFGLLCAGFPTYALLKNELFIGPGHVSLEWAVRWQLFDRTGSGSIFDPKSTAHAVIHSWLDQDAWLPKLSLFLAVPGLLIRRTRAVTFAFAIQVVQLLRGGYLPYPYVIAMIPFAALTVAGVADRVWEVGLEHRPDRAATSTARWRGPLRRLGARLGSVPVPRPLRSVRLPRPLRSVRLPRPLRSPATRTWVRRGYAVAVAGLGVWLAFTVGHAWSYGLRDLRTVDRDAGKAQTLAWLKAHVEASDYVVVDDSFWVDLVRAGHPSSHVVWFTKLDVDKDVRIPGPRQWAGISYVVLDHEDDLSVHMQADGMPSKDTLAQFPTLGKALLYSHTIATFGTGLDAITVREVDPMLAVKAPPAGTVPTRRTADDRPCPPPGRKCPTQ